MSSDEKPMINDAALQVKKLRQARDLLASCFDLLLDNISGPEWLRNVEKLANCNSLTCLWFPAGRTDACLQDTFGTKQDFPADFLRHLDLLVESISPDGPGLLDELAQSAGIVLSDDATRLLFAPDQLIACLDREPARVFLIFRERKVAPNWQDYDRKYLADLLPIIGKSVAIKKQLSQNADIIELNNKINDDSSRGFITVMPDRTMVATNQLAQEILGRKAPLRIRRKKLEFRDSRLQIEFESELVNIVKADKSQLSTYAWYKNIGESTEAGDLLLTMRAINLNSWRIESSSHETSIVITLEKMEQQPAMVDITQLREFYNLTNAQARLARQLIHSGDVEAAADALNISVNTARSHLRAIYSRMGVSSKSQMLQRLGSTLAGRA